MTPARILVVDDEPESRAMLRRALEAEGWRVSEAENGRAALEGEIGVTYLPDDAVFTG